MKVHLLSFHYTCWKRCGMHGCTTKWVYTQYLIHATMKASQANINYKLSSDKRMKHTFQRHMDHVHIHFPSVIIYSSITGCKPNTVSSHKRKLCSVFQNEEYALHHPAIHCYIHAYTCSCTCTLRSALRHARSTILGWGTKV